jgi:hypothetical protein
VKCTGVRDVIWQTEALRVLQGDADDCLRRVSSSPERKTTARVLIDDMLTCRTPSQAPARRERHVQSSPGGKPMMSSGATWSGAAPDTKDNVRGRQEARIEANKNNQIKALTCIDLNVTAIVLALHAEDDTSEANAAF